MNLRKLAPLVFAMALDAQAQHQMQMPHAPSHETHDNSVQHYVQFNRLEASNGGMEWQGQAWIGTDTNKLWLRTEGERVDDRTESADVEALYGRPISRWWDIVAGVRHDFKPGASQDFAAIGIVGVAPYKIDVEATAYIGANGRTSARIEAQYDTLLTNRLILQPLVELNFNGKDDPERHVGSGLSTAEAGLRLRYEVTRQFAPYIGVVYERAFGNTSGLRNDTSDTRFVAGFRIWF